MSKLYTTIKTDLVESELEAKIGVDIQAEPTFVDIPNDLYAAISTNTPEATTSIEATSPEVRQFAYSVPNRLYQRIVPEKPSILAEERIFVYVPKASYNSAGIAKFAIEQFNIIDGRVTIKQSYLTQMLSSNLIKPDIILVVTELPTTGLDNRIYLVPIDSSSSTGYIWNSTTSSWTSLGTVSLNIDDYYTKAEVQALIGGDIQGQIDSIFQDITSLDGRIGTIEIDKQDKLVAGDNITIDPITNVISVSGKVPSEPLPEQKGLVISKTEPTDSNIEMWVKLTGEEIIL